MRKIRSFFVYLLLAICVLLGIGIAFGPKPDPNFVVQEKTVSPAQKQQQKALELYAAETAKLEGMGVDKLKAHSRAIEIIAPLYHLTPDEFSNYLFRDVK